MASRLRHSDPSYPNPATLARRRFDPDAPDTPRTGSSEEESPRRYNACRRIPAESHEASRLIGSSLSRRLQTSACPPARKSGRKVWRRAVSGETLAAWLFLSQGESKQRRPRLHAHILLAIHHIGHRTSRYRRAQVRLPKQLPVTRVDRHELSVAAAAEQHVAGCRQDSPLSLRGAQLEVPFLLAGLGIDRPDRAEHITDRPITREGPAVGRAGVKFGRFLVLYISCRTVFPCGDVEK